MSGAGLRVRQAWTQRPSRPSLPRSARRSLASSPSAHIVSSTASRAPTRSALIAIRRHTTCVRALLSRESVGPIILQASINCNRWLAVRLELISASIILAAAVLAVFSLVSLKRLDAGYARMSNASDTGLNYRQLGRTHDVLRPQHHAIPQLDCPLGNRGRDADSQCRARARVPRPRTRGGRAYRLPPA
jgi:hypothetical protein